ncbi:MAG: MBL fold metallo-hydrolase [Gemmatimonadota bacterium]
MMFARISSGVHCADLLHSGRSESIAAWIVESAAGIILVDPGPASCGGALRDALAEVGAGVSDVRHVLLTHIHLDHAGITGTLARENPQIRVHVHARGAPHMADPSRLLASARLIYGERMEPLWGEFLPVDRDRLIVIEDRARIVVGNRRYAAAHTPGHAVHHVIYLDENEGLAYVGDLAGEGSQHDTPPLPAAPPPDVDLDAWRTSLDFLESLGAEELLLTHFGPVRSPSIHISGMWARLMAWSERVHDDVETAGKRGDDELADRFTEDERGAMTAGLTPQQAEHIGADTIRASWFGLARYWRKRAKADRPADA